MTTDPFEPFDRIRDAIKRVIEPLGVEFLTWSIAMGDDEEDERMCSVLLEIHGDAFLSTDEKTFQKILEATEEAERLAAREKKLAEDAEKTRVALQNIANKRGKGIFDD